MQQGSVVTPVPVMLKHPILARIDEVSRDRHKVCALRDLLESTCCAAELADVAVRHDVCPRPLADLRLHAWANVGGAGWLGDIMDEVQRGVLEVCDALLDGAPPLSSWWILGLTQEFRMLVAPSDEQLWMFMATPRLPPGIIGASKMPFDAIDPWFRPLIQELRDDLDQMLALGSAGMNAE
jgi:hypothetical protein